MTTIDEQGRTEPPVDADETATLLGFLEFHRQTLAWKCADLDAADLSATVGASTMTLGGLLKHLALVETHWFSQVLWGEELGSPWESGAEDPDWEWTSAADDTPEELRSLWEGAVARSRAAVERALEDGGIDRLAERWWPDGRSPTPSLRWIVVHMIEEYARHNGHADLLRESVDGLTGE